MVGVLTACCRLHWRKPRWARKNEKHQRAMLRRFWPRPRQASGSSLPSSRSGLLSNPAK
jgi:hypothetical protein